MHPRRCYRVHRDENGAFLVMWALLLVALLTMVAIVIDLSALREDRRHQRLAADAAVTGGGLSLKRTAAGRLDACENAWAYAAQNLGASDPVPASPCGPYITATDCDRTNPAAATPQTVTGTMGRYTVTITTPVLNGDPLMKADAIGGDLTQAPNSNTGVNNSDGEPCTRIGVRISSDRSANFASVIGFPTASTKAHSVARTAIDEGDLRPSLVVLEPHRCDAMKATGTPSIEVVGSIPLRGGIVIIDDGAACPATGAGSGFVLNVGSGSGPTSGDESHVTAAVNGDIYLRAGGGLCTGSACDPNQLDFDGCWNPVPTLTTCRGYSPAPQPLSVTINRSRIDYLYNCRAGYTTSTGNYRNVTIDGSVMADCPDTTGDYINRLYAQVTPSGSGLRLSSYTTTYNPASPSGACPTLPSPLPPGSIEFNCTLPAGATFTVNGDAWFRQTGPPAFKPGPMIVNGNAIFEGEVDPQGLLEIRGNSFFARTISVSGSGDLRLRGANATYPSACEAPTFGANIAACVKQSGFAAGPPSSSGAAFSFMMGPLQQTGGSVTIDRVMVYGGPAANLSRTGNANLSWFPPTTGPFRKLSYWSDAQLPVAHELSGSGALNVDGVFFAPDAKFRLGGTPAAIPQDAQFWALQLEAAGTATFRMTPDPELPSVPLAPVVRLIR